MPRRSSRFFTAKMTLALLAGTSAFAAAEAASVPAPSPAPRPSASSRSSAVPLPAASPAPSPAAARPAAGKAAASAPKAPATKPSGSRLIDIHIGIPGRAYLGQTLQNLRSQFPTADVTPFAGQEDAFVAAIPEEGISCYVVGPSPDDLKVASVGFNFDQSYMGAKEGDFRTREGIGKGSTVNDLLGTYGRPAEISGERSGKPLLRRGAQNDDPDAPKKYQYASADGATKSYFVVQHDRVLRVVINDLAPLNRHLLKHPPEK